MICDHDCFNCKYEDCVNNDYTKEDFDQQQQLDKEFRQRKKKKWAGQKEASKRYYYEHHEQMLEKGRKYYHSHKEKFREYDRIRKKTHPVSKEKRREYYVRWRDKKKRMLEESKNEDKER